FLCLLFWLIFSCCSYLLLPFAMFYTLAISVLRLSCTYLIYTLYCCTRLIISCYKLFK
ncbi:uncharacterized protein Dwil_GK27955, partial [Drosophila willistoni]